MSADREALLKHYQAMREEMRAALDGLTDEQMIEPSIDGWSIKDHVAHIATWDEIRASEVLRISAGHDSAWRMDGAQDDAYNALSYDLRRSMPLAQAMWELESSRQKLLDAISSATDRGLDPSLYGEAGLVSNHESQHAGWIRQWRDDKGI